MADGSLIFDTKVDTSGFSKGTQSLKQMAGAVQSVFKKTAAVIAATFSVKALVQFGKEAVNFASDVQEVQNVVDTAFGSMSYKMEAFADTCIETYGMSKLTAKEMGSTFMAMAKGIGQTTDVASDKAVELTGRLGDIMSFYNKTASEVNTIGKAIYSGETEPLKSIGIVMTENNLKTYALSKGYKKLYTEMSAAEKLLVRQEYFLEQTSMAAEDFVKTQDSWANQTRILSERWKEFMTICGNGLIQVLTPAVKTLNQMLDSLINVGEELSVIFGISVSSNVSEEAAAAQKEIAGMGESLEAVVEQAEGGTASFDELEIIGGTKDQTGEVGGGNAIADRREETFVTRESEKATGAFEQSLKSLGETIGWLGTVFQTSFMATFGDTSVFDGIIQSVQGIKDALLDMFSVTGVQEAAATFIEAYVSYLGSSVGAFTSVAGSIVSNLLDAIQLSLSDNRELIQSSIIGLFDIVERMAEVKNDFYSAVSDIFTVFRSDEAKQLTADIITLFTNAVLGITELLGLFAVDVVELITAPFVENEESISATIQNTFSAVYPLLSALQESVEMAFGTIRSVYDENLAPVLSSLKEGFVQIGEKLLEVYNTYILPVVQYASEKVNEFKDGPLTDLLSKFEEFAGKVSECVTVIWEEYLLPFILWFIENVAPKIREGLTTAVSAFSDFWANTSETLGFLLDALGGLIDFVTGTLTGNWEKAWEGIKNFFEGIWNTIKNVLETILSVMKTGIFTSLNNIRSKFVSVFLAIKNTVSGIFTALWEKIKGIINNILGGVEGMANGVVRGINKVIDAMNGLSFEIPDWIPGMGGENFGFNIPNIAEVTLPRLATGTVVPANFGEFAAILGDNKREAEIVSPVSAMKQAFKEALAEMGFFAGGEYTFIAQIDGEVLFRETVRQDKMYKKQTGRSALV